jgi:hypothetical protein
MSASASTLSLRISDFTGQRRTRVSAVHPQSTVGELVTSLLTRLGLPDTDVEGRPLAFQARLEREGRHVHSSELVGDALEDEDEITLTPSIDAG